jgi:hypothetical protein
MALPANLGDQRRRADQHHVAAGVQVRIDARGQAAGRLAAAMPMSSENTTPRKPISLAQDLAIQRGE